MHKGKGVAQLSKALRALLGALERHSTDAPTNQRFTDYTLQSSQQFALSQKSHTETAHTCT